LKEQTIKRSLLVHHKLPRNTHMGMREKGSEQFKFEDFLSIPKGVNEIKKKIL